MRTKFRMSTLILVVTSLMILTNFSISYADSQPLYEGTGESTNLSQSEIGGLLEKKYYEVYQSWKNQGINDVQALSVRMLATSFSYENGAYLVDKQEVSGTEYDEVLYFKKDSTFSFTFNAPKNGLYVIAVEYYPKNSTSEYLELSVKVNGQFEFYESRRLTFPFDWQYEKKEFDTDRYGNQIVPKQLKEYKWYKNYVQDPLHLQEGALRFYFKEGENRVTIQNISEDVLIGSIEISAPETTLTYATYLKSHVGEVLSNTLLTYSAEEVWSKNNLMTRMSASKDVNLTPYDYRYDLINVIDGKSWKSAGQSITWRVDIPKSGFYYIALKAKQDQKVNRPVFRNLHIDGQLPFSEARHIRFVYTPSWANQTIADDNDKPYKIFLTKGVHEISLEVDASPFRRVIEKSREIIDDVNALSLDIKKLTGNTVDLNRDFSVIDYIPDIVDRLTRWETQLQEELNYLNKLCGEKKSSSEATFIKMAITHIRTLKEEPNEIPKRLSILSEGSSSILMYLSSLVSSLEENPLYVNKLYLYGDDTKLPAPTVGIWKKMTDGFKRFLLSFTNNPYQIKSNTTEEIEIWVNRPRTYVELMQKMTDREFTTKTGYKVNFSVMPDEGKLILANAAGQQPDAALGISNWLPFELAIRGAVYDLRQFKDFGDFIKVFSPGAFLPYIIDEGVYGIPETQDFWVLFYRKDIFDKLNLPVPNNWDDVLAILPELQRYGMNFYVPLAGSGGFKPFSVTVPFIYQFNGKLYSDDGMSTAINSEEGIRGMEFMAKLFTMYSVPMQVPNFYNHFRYGMLPIGISNFSTYVQLLIAAPEIKGLWDIALYPGVVNANGEVERWAPGSAQSCVIFKSSKKKEETWEFLKWWMSTETQASFAQDLRMTYGDEYIWNSANIEAFKQLPWDPHHKEVILQQWEYLKEVPKTPGSYMLEREISNIWNRIVFQGENPRNAIDDGTIVVNREIRKKMEEFGYIQDGKIVKPYKIATVEMVKGWMRDAGK